MNPAAEHAVSSEQVVKGLLSYIRLCMYPCASDLLLSLGLGPVKSLAIGNDKCEDSGETNPRLVFVSLAPLHCVVEK
jgi:hypothetical protein